MSNGITIISIETFGDYNVRNIQTNSAWSENPYEEGYALVPDEMVEVVLATQGYCDMELNKDGTEIVSFVPREIPDIPDPEPEPTPEDDDDVWNEMAQAISEGVNEV